MKSLKLITRSSYSQICVDLVTRCVACRRWYHISDTCQLRSLEGWAFLFCHLLMLPFKRQHVSIHKQGHSGFKRQSNLCKSTTGTTTGLRDCADVCGHLRLQSDVLTRDRRLMRQQHLPEGYARTEALHLAARRVRTIQHHGAASTLLRGKLEPVGSIGRADQPCAASDTTNEKTVEMKSAGRT